MRNNERFAFPDSDFHELLDRALKEMYISDNIEILWQTMGLFYLCKNTASSLPKKDEIFGQIWIRQVMDGKVLLNCDFVKPALNIIKPVYKAEMGSRDESAIIQHVANAIWSAWTGEPIKEGVNYTLRSQEKQ